MNVIGVIPSRLDASRFPGKPLAKILGMPMIGHCYFRTKLALGVDSTYVATCDNEIADYIHSIGGKVVMTSSLHTRATTRTAEALEIINRNLNKKVDIVIMVQGDEPLITPEAINEIPPYFLDESVEIVNIMSRLKTYEQFIDKNNVKVVVNNCSDALYFSREPIPSPWKGVDDLLMYMQTGIIAFRQKALLNFNSMSETSLERIESIDMNRVLESGGNIKMIPTEFFTLGIDTIEELKYSEKLMKDDQTLKRYLL
jgi:3-deoxy-manno-octulosonate cytidylyltransferase (CMP-KDO synthetase)